MERLKLKIFTDLYKPLVNPIVVALPIVVSDSHRRDAWHFVVYCELKITEILWHFCRTVCLSQEAAQYPLLFQESDVDDSYRFGPHKQSFTMF